MIEKRTFEVRVKEYMKMSKEMVARTLITRKRFNNIPIVGMESVVTASDVDEALNIYMKTYTKPDMCNMLAKLDQLEFPKKCAEL